MQASWRDGRRRSLAAAVPIVVLCCWQLYAYGRVEAHNADSSYYQVLARNLVEDGDYVFNGKPHTRHPPGFPALLAVGSFLLGHDYASLIALMPLCGTVGLVASFVLLSRVEHPVLAFAACAWLASSPDFFRMGTQYLWSDLPYFAVSSVALVLGTGAAAARQVALRTAVLLALMTALGVLIRSAGIALCAAAVATVLFGWSSLSPPGRRVLATAAAASLTVWLTWTIWAQANASPEPGTYSHSYIAQLQLKDPHRPELGRASAADIALRAGAFAGRQMSRFSQILVRAPWLDPVWFSPFILIPMVLVGIGLADSIAGQRSTFVAWYVVAYLSVYALWPFDEGTRFTVPVFPLLFLFGWRGARRLWQWGERSGLRTRWTLPLAGIMTIAAWWSRATQAERGRQSALYVAIWVVTVVGLLVLQVGGPPLWARLGRLVRRYGPITATMLLLAAVGSGIVSSARIAARNLRPSPETFTHAGLVPLAGWLASQPDEDMLMAQQAAILHHLTGRRVVELPVTSKSELLEAAIRRHAVRLIAIADERPAAYYLPAEPARFAALVRARPGCCRLVYAARGYRVYRVGRDRRQPG